MPDNAIYYHLAYGAAILIYAAYGLSLHLRARRQDALERADGAESRDAR